MPVYICHCTMCAGNRERADTGSFERYLSQIHTERLIRSGLHEFGTYVTLTAMWQRAQFGPNDKHAGRRLTTSVVDHYLASIDGVEFVTVKGPYPKTTIRKSAGAFYRDTEIPDIARPGARAKRHIAECKPDECCGLIEGYSEVLRDEYGTEEAWFRHACECWCHDEA